MQENYNFFTNFLTAKSYKNPEKHSPRGIAATRTPKINKPACRQAGINLTLVPLKLQTPHPLRNKAS